MSTAPATVRPYDGAADGWAQGASLVYRPLAAALVARSPHALLGRQVLDVGAGTGVGSEALVEVGAHPVALDASWGMLAWRRGDRPPSVVADVGAVPVRSGAVDDVLAAFVLNHVARPVEALRELARAVRPGGVVLAAAFASTWRSPARDRVDEVAAAHGWAPPEWYRHLKEAITPLLGSEAAMTSAAEAAGLVEVAVDEATVDVGVHRPEQLVAYRLGQAQFADHLRSLAPDAEADLRRAAVEAVAPIMEPYRPAVVVLVARVP